MFSTGAFFVNGFIIMASANAYFSTQPIFQMKDWVIVEALLISNPLTQPILLLGDWLIVEGLFKKCLELVIVFRLNFSTTYLPNGRLADCRRNFHTGTNLSEWN